MRAIGWTMLAVLVGTAGCASSGGAFHVYQSPLLAAEPSTPRPNDRSLDPAQPAERPDETVVAQSGQSVWEKTPPLATKKRKARTFASGMGGRTDEGGGSAESGDFAPAVAAEYVWRTFEINGATIPETAISSIPALWEACRAAGKTRASDPLPGDAVFFHNVFDANADGRNNDWYTHVGVVETVRKDGAARVMSYIGGKVVRFWVDPKRPDEVGDDTQPVNSRLRIPTADDAPFTQYHAGQLFAGYCTLLDAKQQVVVMDEWQPTRD